MIADDCRNNRWSGRNARESYRNDNHTVIDAKYTTGADPLATKLKLCISESGYIRDDANALRCMLCVAFTKIVTYNQGQRWVDTQTCYWFSHLTDDSCFTEKDYMSVNIRIYKFIIYNFNSKQSYTATTSTSLSSFIILRVLYLASWYDFILFTWKYS